MMPTAGPAGSTTDLTDSLTRRRVASPHDRRVASLLRPSRASDARVCRVEETSPLAAAPSRVARLYLERAALLRRRRRRASSRYAFLRLGGRAVARRPGSLLRPVREASLGVLSRDRGGCCAVALLPVGTPVPRTSSCAAAELRPALPPLDCHPVVRTRVQRRPPKFPPGGFGGGRRRRRCCAACLPSRSPSATCSSSSSGWSH